MLEYQSGMTTPYASHHRRMPAPLAQAVDDHGNASTAIRAGYEYLAASQAGISESELIQPAVRPDTVTAGINLPATPPPKIEFPGINDDFTFFPPDVSGAVGPRHVAELLNTGLRVFGRDGIPVTIQISLKAFWSALGTAPGSPASSPYDPHILYDQYTNRWLSVSASNPDGQDGTSSSWILVGVSDTDDPTGDWTLHAIRAASDSIDGFAWPDFPQVGVDPNNLIVTADMFTLTPNPAFVHSDVWIINRSRLSNVGSLVQGVDFVRVHNPGGEFGFAMQPCHTYGQTAATAVNYLVYDGWYDGNTRLRRFLRFQKITGVGATALVNGFGGNNWVEVPCYNFCIADAPQLGCSEPIADNGSNIANAVFRNGKIWTTHMVGASCVAQNVNGSCGGVPFTKAEIAWYEINPSLIAAFPSQIVSRTGRINDPFLSMYFPSIAVNSQECVGIGYTASGFFDYAGGWFAERELADPTGTMRTPVQFIAGQAPYLLAGDDGENRWGDYSATVVDPTDDLTIWTLQEYAREQAGANDPAVCDFNAGQWGTHWAAWTCPLPTGDCNADQHLDLTDFSQFSTCMDGPGKLSVSGPCACVNLDNDFNVDLRDVALFMNLR